MAAGAAPPRGESADVSLPAIDHPPGFRWRRGRNWFFLGLLYAGYYLCRYNLGAVTPELAKEFDYNNEQTGWLSTGRDFGYMIGQLLNGLFADSLGGKQSMAIGGGATAVLGLVFAGFSMWPADAAVLLIGFFVIRTLDGYAQAFGAPGMVKINAAWFRRTERGTFAGIFGAMIQLGQVGAGYFSKVMLAGGPILFGLFILPKLDWRSMFIVPPIVMVVLIVLMWLNVKNHPEEAGFQIRHDDAGPSSEPARRLPIGVVFVKILSHPLIWLNGGAYLCTGFVRRAYDFWWAKYLDNEWHITKASPEFGWLVFLLPISAVIGSFSAGYISDRFCSSKRSPVGTALYGLESLVILAAIIVLSNPAHASPFVACMFLVLISLTCNSSHSIIGTAAVMDIGGRQAAGFALGVVNSFQYMGAMMAGWLLGGLIDQHGWMALFGAMLPFSILGTLLMAGVWYFTRGRIVQGA